MGWVYLMVTDCLMLFFFSSMLSRSDVVCSVVMVGVGSSYKNSMRNSVRLHSRVALSRSVEQIEILR